jgi:oligopeptide transport system ATP-binding protein
MTAALVATGLRKRFRQRRNLLGRTVEWHDAVCGINIRVERGQTVALVGESGAGKSTVGRLVLGLIEADAGRVELLGRDLSELSRRELRRLRASATMIFQDPYSSLNPRLTLAQSVGEPLLSTGTRSRHDRRERAARLFEQVGLPLSYLDAFPYELSGGQLQRAAIARALITEPELIVCDEPVSALDMSIRSSIVELLRDVQKQRHLAYLFVTHDLSLVRMIADHVVVMRRGEIVEVGATARVFETPEHEYTRTLLTAIPSLDPLHRRFGREAFSRRSTSTAL